MRHKLLFLFFTIIGVCAYVMLAASIQAKAQSQGLPIEEFARLPILQDGRIKPLDSFARVELKKFSGKERLSDLSAVQWLAETVFDPGNAIEMRVFSVTNSTIRHQLGLEERKITLYSLTDISGGLQKTADLAQNIMQKPPKDISDNERDLLHIHENALEYTQILRSFSAYLPITIALTPEWAEKAGLGDHDKPSYDRLQIIAPQLEVKLRALIKRKGERPESYTAAEQQLVLLGMQLRTLSDAGMDNQLLRVIPVTVAQKNEAQWVAPWEIINSGRGTPETVEYIEAWRKAALAWQAEDISMWSKAIDVLAKAPASPRLGLELAYNKYPPFVIAFVLFALTFVLGLWALAAPSRFIERLLPVILGIGITAQGLGILVRVVILERPPVGTLYESLLFVGLIAPLVAILFRERVGAILSYLVAGLTAAMIGLLAMSLMGDDDTMKVLTAVLNTRFWLATHVLCITIGYGWCLVTAMVAHVILFGDAMGRLKADQRAGLLKTLQLLVIFSLLFTAVGTILGGVWADQSWGRFWGWDPKENGALLIVLWLVWILHSRYAGDMSERQSLMGYAFVSFIVAVAWIGVNLLGVGLHSYGFMEGVFWGLGLFGALELGVIGCAAWLARRRDGSAA